MAHRRFEEIAAAPAAQDVSDGRLRMIAPEIEATASLTKREQEVAYLIAQGFSRKECARLCALSPHTVADHLKSVYRKLNVNDRMALGRLLLPLQGPRPLA